MASAEFEAIRESKEAVSVWTVHLHFDAFGDLPAKDWYWATGDGVELEDGETYTHKLTGVPRMRHQTDRGNDYAEFNCENTKRALYQEIRPYEPIIERGYVVIREAYAVEPGYYESEINFKGYLRDFSFSDDGSAITFAVLSDTSRPNFPVGNRILTRERCGTWYNVNGMFSPLESPCGWQPEQGGNPIFCSKLLNGPDGCKAHLNSHRFFAVPALGTADVEIVPGSDVPGGFDYETAPCFSKNMFVVMGDFSFIPFPDIWKAIERKIPALGVDVFKGDKLVHDNEIYNVFENPSSEIAIANFDLATIEAKRQHRFYRGNRIFCRLDMLGHRSAFGFDFRRRASTSRLLGLEHIRREESVYNLHTRTGNYLVTNEEKLFFYVVHNRKLDIPL